MEIVMLVKTKAPISQPLTLTAIPADILKTEYTITISDDGTTAFF